MRRLKAYNRIKKIVSGLLCFLLAAGLCNFSLVIDSKAGESKAESEDYSEEDLAYMQELSEAGFPDSYLPQLLSLHKSHPNWTFEAVATGLDWEEVLSENNEMLLTRNLVPNRIMSLYGVDTEWYATPTSWKEVEMAGSFSWTNDAWVEFSGGGWVQASKEAVAYVMDPRNWLTENNIFEFEKLSYNSNISDKTYLTTLKSMLKNTFMADATVGGSGGLTYAEVILKAGQTYNVNPISLCARLIQEKGRGTKQTDGSYKLTDTLAYGVVTTDGGSTFRKYTSKDKGTYTRYYNFFNIGASGTTAQDVINSGGKEAMNEGWTTRYKALMGGAEKFANNYVKSIAGQDTLYFQKFSVIEPEYYYWKQYMQNLLAPINEGYTVRSSYEENNLLDCAFSFKIPTYENMPEEACPSPSVTGGTTNANPNYKLKSLNVTGNTLDGEEVSYSLTPDFSTNTKTYSLEVPYEVKSVTVSATAYDSGATVTGTGEQELEVGDNSITIKCTSAYGTSRKYKINILRGAGSMLLSSLQAKGITLNKDFAATTYKYSANVDMSVESTCLTFATASATAYTVFRHAGESTILGTGSIQTDELTLAEGKNVFYIDVYPSESDYQAYLEKKEAGTLKEDKEYFRTYRVTINRYLMTTFLTDYQYTDTTINGFEPGTTVKDVLANITVMNGSMKVLNSSNEEKSETDIIATGDKVVFYDLNGGQVGKKRKVIIYGDLNGDGLTNILDFALIRRYIIRGIKLSGAYWTAADVNPSSEGVDIFDFAILRRLIVKGTAISQTR